MVLLHRGSLFRCKHLFKVLRFFLKKKRKEKLSKFFSALHIHSHKFATRFPDKLDLKLTPEPFRRDVLQQGEGDAEKSDEQVADSQRADEDVRGRLDRPLLHDDVDHQAVSPQSHEEDQHVGDGEDRLGAVGQLGHVDERLDVVSVDELLAAQVVVAEHLLQPFSSYPAGLLLRLRRRCCHPLPARGQKPEKSRQGSRSSLL